MKIQDIEHGLICRGDYFLEDGCYREIKDFAGGVVHFTDGCDMSIGDINQDDIHLESEVFG